MPGFIDDGHDCHGFGCPCYHRAYDQDRDRDLQEQANEVIASHLEARARAEAEAREQAQEMEVREAVDLYFDNLHAAIWGRAFDLLHNREAAADYIVETLRGVAQCMQEIAQHKREREQDQARIVARQALADYEARR